MHISLIKNNNLYNFCFSFKNKQTTTTTATTILNLVCTEEKHCTKLS